MYHVERQMYHVERQNAKQGIETNYQTLKNIGRAVSTLSIYNDYKNRFRLQPKMLILVAGRLYSDKCIILAHILLELFPMAEI